MVKDLYAIKYLLSFYNPKDYLGSVSQQVLQARRFRLDSYEKRAIFLLLVSIGIASHMMYVNRREPTISKRLVRLIFSMTVARHEYYVYRN